MRCAAMPPGGGAPAGPVAASPGPPGPAPAGSVTVTPVPIATPVPMIGPSAGGLLGGRCPGRPSLLPGSVVETVVVRPPLPLPLPLPLSVTTRSTLLLKRWKRGSERKLAPPPLMVYGVRIVVIAGARGPKLPICAACEVVVTTNATTAIAVETVRPAIRRLFGRKLLTRMTYPPSDLTLDR